MVESLRVVAEEASGGTVDVTSEDRLEARVLSLVVGVRILERLDGSVVDSSVVGGILEVVGDDIP